METETPTREDRVEELNDEIISDKELALSVEKDPEGEGRESTRETSTEDGVGTFKNAYVSLRRLRIKKLKNRKKTSRKKKDQKWTCERDRDWRPPRRRKVKITPKIKLIRTRPISEDEETTESREIVKPDSNEFGREQTLNPGRNHHLLPGRAEEEEERRKRETEEAKKRRRAGKVRRFRDRRARSGPVIGRPAI